MSCIYGPHQFGTEDQGWVAHFLIRALDGASRSRSTATAGRCATCCTSTTSSTRSCSRRRDIDRSARAGLQPRRRAGNAVSLLELLDRHRRAASAGGPRSTSASGGAGDQRYYVSDTRRLRAGHRLARATSVARGRARLCARWLQDARPVRACRGGCAACSGGVMRVALVNPPWTFEGSIYFGCREPHLPLELGYAKALLERGRPRGADARRAARRAGASRRWPSRWPASARHDGGDDGAELPVLALRAARAARSRSEFAGGARRSAAARPSPSARTARRRRDATLRKLGVDVVVMGECEEVRRAQLARRAGRLAQRALDRLAAATAIVHDRRPHASALRRPAGAALAGRVVAAAPIITTASTAQPEGPAPRWRPRAAAPITAPSAPRSNFRDAYRRRAARRDARGDRPADRAGRRATSTSSTRSSCRSRRCSRRWSSAPVEFGVQTRIDLWKPEHARAARRGRLRLDRGRRREPDGRRAATRSTSTAGSSTDELAERLIFAQAARAVRAGQPDRRADDDQACGGRLARATCASQGVWANEPVPLFPYPGSPDYRRALGPA